MGHSNQNCNNWSFFRCGKCSLKAKSPLPWWSFGMEILIHQREHNSIGKWPSRAALGSITQLAKIFNNQAYGHHPQKRCGFGKSAAHCSDCLQGSPNRPLAYLNNKKKVQLRPLRSSTCPCSRSTSDEGSGGSYGPAALEPPLIQPGQTLISAGACTRKHKPSDLRKVNRPPKWDPKTAFKSVLSRRSRGDGPKAQKRQFIFSRFRRSACRCL